MENDDGLDFALNYKTLKSTLWAYGFKTVLNYRSENVGKIFKIYILLK